MPCRSHADCSQLTPVCLVNLKVDDGLILHLLPVSRVHHDKYTLSDMRCVYKYGTDSQN